MTQAHFCPSVYFVSVFFQAFVTDFFGLSFLRVDVLVHFIEKFLQSFLRFNQLDSNLVAFGDSLRKKSTVLVTAVNDPTSCFSN